MSRRPKADGRQAPAGLVAPEQPAEGDDGGAAKAGAGDGEVVLLVLQRQEAEAGGAGDRLQGDAPRPVSE